ncbi:hypothetical protein Glove_141g101 [Diversispora epigaea]|uniref:Uncharacterized protein n=1 Tax=Diversispora epigaea TaxID=1348612 RepID=A0A397J126_9GLOM|nr:hypothetical protein Glove_141g101 [Diversispora epigaea]
MQFPENFRRKIRQIREELMVLAGDAQLVVDHTGAYAILGNNVTNLIELASDDTLFPYVMDVMTVLEEEYDLMKDMSDFDIPGLLSIAINFTNSNGQRVNAYRRLGEYIHATQAERTTTLVVDKKNRTCECCGKTLSTPQKLRQHYNSSIISCKLFNRETEESTDSEYYTADEGPDEYFQ